MQDGVLFINSGSIYDAPPKRSIELSFEGAHLVGRSVSDEQDVDDAENDKLTVCVFDDVIHSCIFNDVTFQRRPVVIRRNGSQVGDQKYAELAAELAKSQEEPLQDPNRLSVVQPRLNAISDPCIVTKVNEIPDLKEWSPLGSSEATNIQKLTFKVSPCPSIRINPSSPTMSAKSVEENDASNIDSKRKRKKSRHVQFPPTPDYKKTDKTAFDFSSSSDEY